ncbi:MAG: 16S rRNA (uracil(1498)-N(3))-methyltransferase [Paracoccaceae bacterium]
MAVRTKIRLFVEAPLGAAQGIVLNKEQSNYLFAVMRLKSGAHISVFNGCDGEWLAEVTSANKRGGTLACVRQTAPLRLPPDLWLLFAPIKKARTAFIVEKATELGVARILPVLTDFTNTDRLNIDRLRAHALEASEQCGGTFIPEVSDVEKLNTVLDNWPAERQVMFCDETQTARPALEVLGEKMAGKWAIVIGPEGGFSGDEAEKLRAIPGVTPVSLGPRILRADTAVVTAISLWQSALGDW